jgi:hypothetical protein
MRIVYPFVFFLALVPIGAVGASKAISAIHDTNPTSHTEIAKQIAEVKDEEDRAMQLCVESKGEAGVSVLNRIYHPNMVFVTKQGALLTRTQRIENLRSGNLKFITFGRKDYSYFVYNDGNTVVQTGIATSDVIYNGKEDNSPRRFTNVFVKLGGQWRLVGHQATTVAQHKRDMSKQ